MRPRTFILLILVLLVLAVVVVLVIANISGGGLLDSITGTGDVTVSPDETPEEEPGLPPPTPTPALRFDPVVVAKGRIPVGTPLREDLLEIQERPNTNIALQGEYTFSDMEELIGKIVKVNISRGQAILRPMIAVTPNDLASLGSDLPLFVDDGNVAVAFPINRYSGVAYAMRPGDQVDVMVTSSVVEIDEEYQAELPNRESRVFEAGLLEGQAFLFDAFPQGRLEFAEEINQVVEIIPLDAASEDSYEEGKQIPRRITQLTIQQAEVLHVGAWVAPLEIIQLQEDLDLINAERLEQADAADAELPTPTPLPQRYQTQPDMVILNLPLQDALALKYALERGADIDLALRAQGDNSLFVTTSVSLFQLVEQGALRIPPNLDFDLDPRADTVVPPSIPNFVIELQTFERVEEIPEEGSDS